MIQRIIDRTQSEIMAERKRQRAQQLDKLRRGERVRERESSVVNVKLVLLPGAEIPQYAKPADSGFDLVAQEDYVVEPGATVLVRTGIALEIPDGYEVQVRPRSGISLNTKLRVANSPGTGDSSYRGEIKVIIDNIAQVRYYGHSDVKRHTSQTYATISGESVPTETVRHYRNAHYDDEFYTEAPRYALDGSYLIRKGDRIAQAVISPVSRANFVVVAELSETERGDGGFGHSGVSI
ncbi:dUTP diphosphatase [Paenibacillus sp. FSL K6-2859]|uniref:dUTP diphosphatase n=1 Tax=Paenibacillus sp. FSL K6-2859 TaxID=2921482 RepID=UPI0030FA29E2